MEYFGFLLSVCMGITLGLIGGGGSILTVPLLVYIFGIQPLLATACSLFIVGTTALVGGLFSFSRREVYLKTGFIFALPSFLGVYFTRAYLIPLLPDPLVETSFFNFSKSLFMMLTFALLMIAASFSMIQSKSNVKHLSDRTSFKKYSLIALEGMLVGGVTGFVGAGGGFLIIPALVVLVGLPMKKAIGTSLFIIAVKSLFGFLGDLQSGAQVEWALLLKITSFAILGLFGGMTLARRISETKLKKTFGYFVLLMGLVIFVDQILKSIK